MQIQLIRNATMKLTIAGRTILTDPMLSPKDAVKSFAGIARNPTVELPFGVADVIQGVEMVLVSHKHPDHIDTFAAAELPNQIALFCQPGDETAITGMGFLNTVPIQTAHTWQGITLIRTDGRHGQGKILEHMGMVSGFIFRADGEPTVYWVGDSILCEDVENSILEHKPAIIITHSGGATIPDFEPIIMDADQTLKLFDYVSDEAVVVAIHMEALDHCTVTRNELREMAQRRGITKNRLLIPDDGETISF